MSRAAKSHFICWNGSQQRKAKTRAALAVLETPPGQRPVQLNPVMKKEKRVRTKGSKRAVSLQPQTAPPSVAQSAPAAPRVTQIEHGLQSFPWRFSRATLELFKMVDEEERRRESEKSDCTRLRILHNATAILAQESNGLLCDIPLGGNVPRTWVKPFGPIEPTHEVEMARFHIRDVWKQAQTTKACDVLGGLLSSLHDCIMHHPGLRAESAALAAISEGHNELVGFELSADRGRWMGRKLDATELWFAKKLRGAECVPFSGYIALLDDVKDIFVRDSCRSKVGASIVKILTGRNTIQKVGQFLDSL